MASAASSSSAASAALPRDYYAEFIQLHRQSLEGAQRLSGDLDAEPQNEKFDLMKKVAAQVKDRFTVTLKDLGQMQLLSQAEQVEQLIRFVQLNFLISSETNHELFLRQMRSAAELSENQRHSLSEENDQLRKENERLRKVAADQILAFSQAQKPQTKEPWRETRPGLNLEGTCLTAMCEAKGKRVISHIKGKGPHDLRAIMLVTSCPLCNQAATNVHRIWLERCSFTIDVDQPVGMGWKTVKVEKKGREEGIGAHSISVLLKEVGLTGWQKAGNLGAIVYAFKGELKISVDLLEEEKG